MSCASTFLKNLLLVSEKAANIARAIRDESHLLSLLVMEKKKDKNPRFLRDFKTLADVMIQEVVRHDLCKEYPELVGHICGEESNEFVSINGLYVGNLVVGENEQKLADQLYLILGDKIASRMLVRHLQSSVDIEDVNVSQFPSGFKESLPMDELSIWIDPIDSTAEYINGSYSEDRELEASGLPCVTVLIGAFHRETGLPVAGVINQPFYSKVNNKWSGRCFWGLQWQDKSLSSIPVGVLSRQKVVVVSSSECPAVKARLAAGGFRIVEIPGAGYKLLCVALGLAHAYVLSKGTTYYWDTCAPGALLRSLGGMIVDYSSTVSREIRYKEGLGSECCNKGGIIAVRDIDVLEWLICLLK